MFDHQRGISEIFLVWFYKNQTVAYKKHVTLRLLMHSFNY